VQRPGVLRVGVLASEGLALDCWGSLCCPPLILAAHVYHPRRVSRASVHACMCTAAAGGPCMIFVLSKDARKVWCSGRLHSCVNHRCNVRSA
jgi:hypothetical protein